MSTDETINEVGAQAQPAGGDAFDVLRDRAAREIAAVEIELRATMRAMGKTGKGEDLADIPEDLRIRQWPGHYTR